MSSGNTIFSGNSRYANDLQQVIDRSIAIASLPLRQLQSARASMASEGTAIQSLADKFSAYRGAMEALNSATVGAPAVSLGNPTVASVAASADAMPAQLSIEVVSVGSYSSALSADGLPKVTDPSTQSLQAGNVYSLVVNGTPFEIVPPVGSLNSLAKAINESGAPVEASIINVGSPGSADYRLVVRSSILGTVDVDLQGTAGSLTQQTTVGTEAQYRLNDYPPTPIVSNSRTVTIAPGVTAELLTVGKTEVNLVPDMAKLQDSITAMVTAFNAVTDELDTHRGQGTGALSGDSLPAELGRLLRGITDYVSTNPSISNLADLGLTLDRTGYLQFDSVKFAEAFKTDANSVRSFLGASSSDGFLKRAADMLSSVDSLSNGLLTQALEQNRTALSKQDLDISDQQERIDLLSTNLRARISAADATIALLEQQLALLTGMFEATKNNANN